MITIEMAKSIRDWVTNEGENYVNFTEEEINFVEALKPLPLDAIFFYFNSLLKPSECQEHIQFIEMLNEKQIQNYLNNQTNELKAFTYMKIKEIQSASNQDEEEVIRGIDNGKIKIPLTDFIKHLNYFDFKLYAKALPDIKC